MDSTAGGNCVLVELPSRPLVLVAGTEGGDSVPRECDIPSGSRVVLPAINYSEWLGETVGENRKLTRELMDIASASATVDDAPAEVKRIRSSRFLLNTERWGLEGVHPTVSDGYWLVVDLPDGEHTVTTSGEVPLQNGDVFSTATQYTSTVG